MADKANEVETVECAWLANRGKLYQDLTEQVNEKLNTAIQELEYDGIADPLVLYFSSSTIAKHFARQLESHGWIVTLDEDDDIIQVDVVKSIDQMSCIKPMQ